MIIATRTVLDIVLIMNALFLFPQGRAFAQDSSPPATSKPAGYDFVPITDEDIQMMRKDIRSQRKQIIAANMKLTDVESETAVQQWVDVDESVAQLRRRYIPSFRKVLSPKNTALFYQLDRRVQLLIDLQLASSLPLIQP